MNKHASRLVQATKGWNTSLKTYSEQPKGQFGRIAKIETGAVTLNSDEIDFEFTVPFDDDTEANEAEITIYNLSNQTISGIKYNKNLTITAGYKEDTGVIFSGYVSKVKTRKEGIDKITTVYALDDMDLKERDLANVTYDGGTNASYILKDLIGKVHLPVAAFNPKRDWIYEDSVTVDGGLMDNIRKYAKVCGISVYINKGKIYARHLSEGNNLYFNVSADTGLIGSPEQNVETISAEDYNDEVTTYSCKMILQHRINTAGIINLSSQNFSGEFRVKSGKHTFNQSEAITEFTCI